MAEEHDPEKHAVEKAASLSSNGEVRVQEIETDGIYAREELLDPAKEETLHRGLSARQIQMIAVRTFIFISIHMLAQREADEGVSSSAVRLVQVSLLARARLSCAAARWGSSWDTASSAWCATWSWSPSER